MKINYLKILILLFVSIVIWSKSYAQVKFGDAPNLININSLMELESTNKGFVLPRVTTVQRIAFPSNTLNGMIVFDSTANCVFQRRNNVWHSLCSISSDSLSFLIGNNAQVQDSLITFLKESLSANNGITRTNLNFQLGGLLTQGTTITASATNTLAIIGLQSGTLSDSVLVSDPTTGSLKRISTANINKGEWHTLGNIGNIDNTNFLGTIDNVPLNFRVNNQKAGRIDFNLQNTFLGISAGSGNSTGSQNSYLGYWAGLGNTSGSWNVYIGRGSGLGANSGNFNTAVGSGTLYSSGSANNNTALGYYAGSLHRIGDDNTFIGTNAGTLDSTGTKNTEIGSGTSSLNKIGSNLVSIGYQAGFSNTLSFNQYMGFQAGYSDSSGITNMYVGYQSGFGAKTGSTNTGLGYKTLFANNAGSQNTAAGFQSLLANTSGNNNAAFGNNSLRNNTSGSNNVAIGNGAMNNNTTVGNQTAVGFNSLFNSTTGINNTAYGYQSMFSNSSGNFNTANGHFTLYANTSGLTNTAIGYYALFTNTVGSGNTGIGSSALENTKTGSDNTAIGNNALRNNLGGANNAAIGFQSGIYDSTGSNNTYLGSFASNPATTISITNATAIGFNARVSKSNAIILGRISDSTGIGNTAPTNRLHVTAAANPVRFEGVQSGAISDSILSIDANGVVRKINATTNNASEPWFNTATSAGATSNTQNIYQLGNVGIGISASTSAALNVNANAASVGIVARGSANNYISSFLGSAINSQSFGALISAGTSSADAALNVRNAAATVPILYARGDGNVGIGTISPSTKLNIIDNTASVYALDVSQNGAGGSGIRGVSLNSGYGVYGQSNTSSGGYFLTNALVNGSYALVASANNSAASTGVGGGIFLSTSGKYLAGGFQNGNGGVSNGDFGVVGVLSKSSGTFKIDHPQDPANKYLIHSFVESPDMMNVYNGNITTDSNGNATVNLPNYFEAENKDFRYQLTVVDQYQFAQVRITQKIRNNTFIIKTDKPNIEISWQVTGVRQDAWANAHRVIAETPKEQENKGKYLNPEVFGKDKKEGIYYIDPAKFAPTNGESSK